MKLKKGRFYEVSILGEPTMLVFRRYDSRGNAMFSEFGFSHVVNAENIAAEVREMAQPGDKEVAS